MYALTSDFNGISVLKSRVFVLRIIISFSLLLVVVRLEPSGFDSLSGTGARGYFKAREKSITLFILAEIASKVLSSKHVPVNFY